MKGSVREGSHGGDRRRRDGVWIEPDLHPAPTLRQMANASAALSYCMDGAALGAANGADRSYLAGAAAAAATGVAVNSPETSNGFTSIVPFISLADGRVAV